MLGFEYGDNAALYRRDASGSTPVSDGVGMADSGQVRVPKTIVFVGLMAYEFWRERREVLLSRWPCIILLIIHADFRTVRLSALVFLTLPFALIGGVFGAVLGGGVLTLGSLVGFVTVLGIAARNGIMLVSHYRHLEEEEGEPFGLDLVVRGSLERLAPILMTALATGLALVPLAVAGNKPGHEIEHPMAVVILGGLVTSTVLNLFLMPSLYLAFGHSRRTDEDEQMDAGHGHGAVATVGGHAVGVERY